MKYLMMLLGVTLMISHKATAQTEAPTLKLSLQTDLIAYTTNGGYSIWAVAQHHKNRLSLAYVNFPNRYAAEYEETGIKVDDSFVRLGLWRYASDRHAFFYGANFEYHWLKLAEDNNREVLNDNNLKIGAIVGYEWRPWNKKDNFLSNFSIAPWAGPTFVLNKNSHVFENTGSVYEAASPIEASVGINLGYTLYKK